MPVYVDPVIRCRPTPTWPFSGFCRMTADELVELHEAARKLYVHHDHYRPGRVPHYEITPNIRKRAVALGAIPLDGMAAARRLQAARLKATA